VGKASRLKRELRFAGVSGAHPRIPAMNRPTGQLAHVSHQSLEVSSGPTPPPAHVEAYERICPGAAERFLKLAEDEAQHRRKHENSHLAIVEANAKASRSLVSRGQIFAFLIAMSGIGAGVWLSLNEARIAGSIIGGGSLATIILAFLPSNRSK
jgi:uncharacterized membrane protein